MDRVGWFEFITAIVSFVAGWFTPTPRRGPPKE